VRGNSELPSESVSVRQRQAISGAWLLYLTKCGGPPPNLKFPPAEAYLTRSDDCLLAFGNQYILVYLISSDDLDKGVQVC
jgi:hypothetical protein